jgi:hypothetical protein
MDASGDDYMRTFERGIPGLTGLLTGIIFLCSLILLFSHLRCAGNVLLDHPGCFKGGISETKGLISWIYNHENVIQYDKDLISLKFGVVK